MAIHCNEKEGLFTLYTKNTMYQMKADSYGVLLHTYYGARTREMDYSYLICGRDRGFAGNPYEAGMQRTYSLDVLPQEYPSYGAGDYRRSALKIQREDGSQALELRFVKYELLHGKYKLPGLPAFYQEEKDTAETLVVTLKDTASPLLVHLYYGVLEEKDMITRAVCVENPGDKQVRLERVMSMNLDISQGDLELLTFYGRHEMERQLSRSRLHHGVQSVGSTRGTSSHHYNPFVILADEGTSETSGSCIGVSFLYSGDFLAEAERDQVKQTRLVMGLHPDNFSWILEPGEKFWSPEAAMVYSDTGLETLSHRYHRAVRRNLCRGKMKNARRPILLNNWEGTYFDFHGEKLVSMAAQAADLGVELFVLDDGWFGKRDDDNSGLGDWFVNEKKLGCTLGELSEKIHGMGLKFGIWFEPECISMDSELYREHPDWALAVPGKKPMLSRNQLVLDFSRKDVRDHVFEQMCRVLDNAKIEYLKWDFNRSISDIYSKVLPAERQGETAHRYVLGLYEFLEKLNQRYPDMLVEGCSGGGGRFDGGMLYYTPQIWCSDDTDAIERLKIQYGTSFAYPVSTMGAHVSACPNHQTRRITPLGTRAVTAMSGTFGYELDPAKLTEEEKEEIRQQIRIFQEQYELIQKGDYYRLTSPFSDREYHAWEIAAPDGEEALLNVVTIHNFPNPAPEVIKLRGLEKESDYEVRCIAPDRLKGEGMDHTVISGDALMKGGFLLPFPEVEYEAFQYHLVKVKK